VPRPKSHTYGSGFAVLYAGYVGHAHRRALIWALSMAFVAELTRKPCHYCGTEPTRVRKGNPRLNQPWIYNGIDRVDNATGYTPENVVPCCFVCNRAKGELSHLEFCAYIARAYRHIVTQPGV
jgi:hypothetical protein